MNSKRFIHFTQMVDTTQKCVKRIEASFAPQFGIKSVHLFWLHELSQHPEGLTATELAQRRMVDRSLISREMDERKRHGLVEAKNDTGKNYNARLLLTEKGHAIAEQIGHVALAVQNEASQEISEEELLNFYATFEKIRDGLITIAQKLEEKKENGHVQ